MKSDVPRHVAIVMDGNGRWAKERGLPRLMGHHAGMDAMTEIVRHASDAGIGYLTVYAFSTENWRRSADEVTGIFGLLVKFVRLKLRELVENNVIVSVIGDDQPIPADARAALKKTIADTAGCTGMRFIIALNYGSRADIVQAARRFSETVAADGGASAQRADADDEAAFAACLSTSGTPDPDLVIRTSGERRLSNFLLWESAYSEFVFTDVLWPDFTPAEFDRCIGEYNRRERRFGGRK